MPNATRDQIQRLQAELARNPASRSFVHLAEAYRQAGDTALAHRVLDQGLTRHRDYPSALVVRARVLADEGEERKAETVWREVLRLDPENMLALRALGDLAEAAGRRDEAMRYYREVVRMENAEPDDEDFVPRAASDELAIEDEFGEEDEAPAPAAADAAEFGDFGGVPEAPGAPADFGEYGDAGDGAPATAADFGEFGDDAAMGDAAPPAADFGEYGEYGEPAPAAASAAPIDFGEFGDDTLAGTAPEDGHDDSPSVQEAIEHLIAAGPGAAAAPLPPTAEAGPAEDAEDVAVEDPDAEDDDGPVTLAQLAPPLEPEETEDDAAAAPAADEMPAETVVEDEDGQASPPAAEIAPDDEVLLADEGPAEEDRLTAAAAEDGEVVGEEDDFATLDAAEADALAEDADAAPALAEDADDAAPAEADVLMEDADNVSLPEADAIVEDADGAAAALVEDAEDVAPADTAAAAPGTDAQDGDAVTDTAAPDAAEGGPASGSSPSVVPVIGAAGAAAAAAVLLPRWPRLSRLWKKQDEPLPHSAQPAAEAPAPAPGDA
ncbi:MAG TPA: hypothetical protein VNP72_06460, partial [Longimicrobium sp.]|nr:hypothetical protein [Longimicrobium sp.]